MKNIFEGFRSKYKVSKMPIVNEKDNKKEEAKQLAMKLNMLFVSIPILKPYDENNQNKVKLLQEHIDIILDVINSKNELITQYKDYEEIKQILQEILSNNENGIEINEDLLSKSRKIQRFYYNFQDQKYWEEKSF